MEKEIQRIINKQFEIIGENIRFEDIVKKEGFIQVGDTKKTKSVAWYELYKFKDEQQYNEWEAWALKELTKIGRERELIGIILQYSLNYPLVRMEKGDQIKLF